MPFRHDPLVTPCDTFDPVRGAQWHPTAERLHCAQRMLPECSPGRGLGGWNRIRVPIRFQPPRPLLPFFSRVLEAGETAKEPSPGRKR